MSAVLITSLQASYDRVPVLLDVSLSVAAGTTTAILGASGGGKTTLLRAIAGFFRPQAGHISIGDQVVSDRNTFVPPHRRAVGYVRQEGALFPHLDVAGNLTFGLPRSSRRQAAVVGELLELVGLPRDLAQRRPDQLSGGQQQRVALARALARKPAVVLLDEPFSSLDAGLRAQTRQVTAAALAERNATTVLVTHDQAEALSFADQVAILRRGELAQVGSPAHLYDAPVDPEVAQFLGDAVLLPGSAHGTKASCALGTVNIVAPADGAVTLVLRPEQIRLVDPSNGDYGPNTVDAVVGQVSYFGHEAMMRLELSQKDLVVLARVRGSDAAPPGTPVVLHVEGKVRAFPA